MGSQTFNFVLTIKSPVHIGCGEDYEPYSYFLDKDKSEIVIFEPLSLMKILNESQRQEFINKAKEGKVSNVCKTVQSFRDIISKVDGYRVHIPFGFTEKYEKAMGEGNFQQFQVMRTAYLKNDGRPYIPGSSLKGAIRTAYLNYLAEKKERMIPNPKEKGKDLEEYLLNFTHKKIQEDPFRMVKVSDFMPVGEVKTEISYALNFKKKSGEDGRGPKQIIETICLNSKFIGSIEISYPEDDKATIKDPIAFGCLQKSIEDFFSSLLLKYSKYQIVDGSVPVFGQDECVLQIGRHSGAEAMTVESYRNVKIMGKRGEKPIYLPHSTTIWLASQKETGSPDDQLFSLISLKGLAPNEIAEFLEKEKNYKLNALKAQEEKIKKEKALKEAKLKADKEAQAKKDAEAQVLGSLSPEAKTILESIKLYPNTAEKDGLVKFLKLNATEQKILAPYFYENFESRGIYTKTKSYQKPLFDNINKVKELAGK